MMMRDEEVKGGFAIKLAQPMLSLHSTPKDLSRSIAIARHEDSLIPTSVAHNRAVLEISKSSQLDAQNLDDEAIRILNFQAARTLQFLAVMYYSVRAKLTNLLTDAPPTPPPVLVGTPFIGGDALDALARLFLWYFTFRLNKPTPGSLIQNLRARNEAIFSPHPHLHGVTSLPGDLPTRFQRLGMLLLDVCFPLIWGRLRDRAVENDWPARREREWYVIETIDKAHRLATLANLVAFLYDGRYRGLAERLLSLRHVYARDESVKSVSFEYINQQLLFEGLSNLMLVLLPLVDWDRLKRRANSLTRRVAKVFAILLASLRRRFPGIASSFDKVWRGRPDADADDDEGRVAVVVDEEEDALEEAWGEVTGASDGDAIRRRATRRRRDLHCAVCGADPANMAHLARPCGHAHCYYCLKIQTGGPEGGDLVACAACDEPIISAERVT